MERFELGSLMKSKAGHDKGEIFVIIKVEKEYVYLVDGKYRTLANPKKKNKKHVQPILFIEKNLYDKLKTNQKIIDEDIKRAIKCYNATSLM